MIDRLRIPERLVQLGPHVVNADITARAGLEGIDVVFEATVRRDEAGTRLGIKARFRSAFTIAEYTDQRVGEAIEQAMGKFEEVA